MVQFPQGLFCFWWYNICMLEVVPAINAESFDKIREQIKLVEPYVKWVQIDVADGTFTKKDGTVLSVNVIEPLRRELACKFLVSGIVNLTKNENMAILNYGDGECDDLAIITINGQDHEIHLSNR